MRGLFLAMILAAGLGFVAVPNASAAPANGAGVINALNQTSDISTVAMGCGRGWHRNWRGRCVPNRRWRR